MKKYIVLSVNDNVDYLYFTPLTCWAVMWGVDMITHQRYGKQGSGHVQEMLKYQSYINALKNHGMTVFIGSKGTAFDNILQVWEKEKSLQP